MSCKDDQFNLFSRNDLPATTAPECSPSPPARPKHCDAIGEKRLLPNARHASPSEVATPISAPPGQAGPINRFLRDRDVAERYAVTRATIWRWVKDVSDFPAPVQIAPGTTRWAIEDLEAYDRVCKAVPKIEDRA